MANYSAELRELRKQLATIQDQIEGLTEAAAADFGDEIQDYRAMAQKRLKEAADAMKEKADHAREVVSEKAKAADDYAHENPWQVIAGVAAVALIIGWAARSRR